MSNQINFPSGYGCVTKLAIGEEGQDAGFPLRNIISLRDIFTKPCEIKRSPSFGNIPETITTLAIGEEGQDGGFSLRHISQNPVETRRSPSSGNTPVTTLAIGEEGQDCGFRP
jgi:hypothetical protein